MCLMRPFLFHVANNKILNIYYAEGCILQKQKRNVFVLIMVSMQISPPPSHVCVLIWRSESWFSSTMCVPEIELNSLGLATSILTRWAISVAQLAHIIEVKRKSEDWFWSQKKLITLQRLERTVCWHIKFLSLFEEIFVFSFTNTYGKPRPLNDRHVSVFRGLSIIRILRCFHWWLQKNKIWHT